MSVLSLSRDWTPGWWLQGVHEQAQGPVEGYHPVQPAPSLDLLNWEMEMKENPPEGHWGMCQDLGKVLSLVPEHTRPAHA